MSEDNRAIGLDAVLKELGPFGTYNIVNYALLLYPCFLAGMYGSVFVFQAPDIDYRCEIRECEDIGNNSLWIHQAIPQENTGRLSKCERYPFSINFINYNSTCSLDNLSFNTSIKEKCSSYIYSGDSAVKDFNLGCQDWKRTLIGTIHNAGLFFSLPLTGFISDRYGRKLSLILAALMNCIFGFVRSFSFNYYMMVVLEFLESGLGAGAYTSAFVLGMELVGPRGRVSVNSLIGIVFVFGGILLSGLSWLLQDWRTLLRIIYGPSCLILSYMWILNESVRWLLSKGKREEALKILKKAAEMNKVELSEQTLGLLHEVQNENTIEEIDVTHEEVVAKNESSIFIEVIRSSIIIKRLVICSFLWITCTLVYYGLSINSVSLAGNMYINFMLVAFIEIPATFCCLYTLDRFGRKKVMIITYMLGAILCIGLAFLPKNQSWWSLVVYLSGKFCITVSYFSVYIYVSEVFPTNVRQSLLAVCSTTGRVGSTLAPLTPLLNTYYENLHVIFFGCLAVVAGLLVFTLPETINQPLPDSIEEAERLSKGNNRLFSA